MNVAAPLSSVAAELVPSPQSMTALWGLCLPGSAKAPLTTIVSPSLIALLSGLKLVTTGATLLTVIGFVCVAAALLSSATVTAIENAPFWP